MLTLFIKLGWQNIYLKKKLYQSLMYLKVDFRSRQVRVFFLSPDLYLERQITWVVWLDVPLLFDGQVLFPICAVRDPYALSPLFYIQVALHTQLPIWVLVDKRNMYSIICGLLLAVPHTHKKTIADDGALIGNVYLFTSAPIYILYRLALALVSIRPF